MGEESEPGHPEVAFKRAWSPSWSESEKGMIIVVDETVYSEHNGDSDSVQDKLVQLRRRWRGQKPRQEVWWLIKHGCHGEQSPSQTLNNGMVPN